jgi:hypothetical protein
MAEMVIFAYDREGDSIEKTAKLPQRGDVVAVREDGWKWGTMELNSPYFIHVIVPDAVAADLQVFLTPEQPQTGMEDALPVDISNTLQYRGYKVDVDAYSGGSMRAATSTTVPLADVLALKTQRPPIPDPKVIGQSERVIG